MEGPGLALTVVLWRTSVGHCKLEPATGSWRNSGRQSCRDGERSFLERAELLAAIIYARIG
jgi:hypothetical protein